MPFPIRIWIYILPPGVRTAMPPNSIDRTSTRPNQGWLLWMMPNVAVGMFIVAMIALVWLLQKRDFDQQLVALERDAQWTQQTLRANLQGDEDFLQGLAREAANGQIDSNRFRARSWQPTRTFPQSPGSMRTRPSAQPSCPSQAGTALAGRSRTASKYRASALRALQAVRRIVRRISAKIPARPSI